MFHTNAFLRQRRHSFIFRLYYTGFLLVFQLVVVVAFLDFYYFSPIQIGHRNIIDSCGFTPARPVRAPREEEDTQTKAPVH